MSKLGKLIIALFIVVLIGGSAYYLEYSRVVAQSAGGRMHAQEREKQIVLDISRALPPGWFVADRVTADNPWWAFSKDTAYKLVLAGPTKTGYSYFRDDGSLISKEYFMREAVIVWIGAKQFDPKLAFWNRVASAGRVFRAKISVGEYSLYLMGTAYSVPPSSLDDTSPPGTHLAIPLPFDMSWKHYFSDIKKAVDAEH